MQYRRLYVPGATYFFTVVTHERQPVFADPARVDLLRTVMRREMVARPFAIDAMVVLPDHLHAIWILPKDDADFSVRWRRIKSEFSRGLAKACGRAHPVWQPRFWEHVIRNEQDHTAHQDYIHINPVKHGLVTAPADWPHSSFHRFVRQGVYPPDWGTLDVPVPVTIGRE
jgi:putative transposase